MVETNAEHEKIDSVTLRLNRCGPLLDVSWTAATFLKLNFVGALVLPPFLAVWSQIFSDDRDDFGVARVLLHSFLGLLFGMPFYWAFSSILRCTHGARRTCVYLRAFKSDEDSSEMRMWLKAGLGADFRLCGIRSPKKRSIWPIGFVNPLLKGLLYAGTNLFEMEAPNRNWIARLLSTLSSSDFAFVDVRNETPYVMEELSLSHQVCGLRRLAFIVDGRRSEADWVNWISASLKTSVGPQLAERLVYWPETDRQQEKEAFLIKIQQLVADASIESQNQKVSKRTLRFVRNSLISMAEKEQEERAKKGIPKERIIPSELWNSRFYETAEGIVVLGILLWSGCLFLFLQITPMRSIEPYAVFHLFWQALAWVAIVRLYRESIALTKINPLYTPPAKHLRKATLWTFLTLLITAFFIYQLVELES